MEAPEVDGSQWHVVAIVENTTKDENVWITTEMIRSSYPVGISQFN
jgi:hypothetical protein